MVFHNDDHVPCLASKEQWCRVWCKNGRRRLREPLLLEPLLLEPLLLLLLELLLPPLL